MSEKKRVLIGNGRPKETYKKAIIKTILQNENEFEKYDVVEQGGKPIANRTGKKKLRRLLAKNSVWNLLKEDKQKDVLDDFFRQRWCIGLSFVKIAKVRKYAIDTNRRPTRPLAFKVVIGEEKKERRVIKKSLGTTTKGIERGYTRQTFEIKTEHLQTIQALTKYKHTQQKDILTQLLDFAISKLDKKLVKDALAYEKEKISLFN